MHTTNREIDKNSMSLMKTGLGYYTVFKATIY